MDVTVREKAKLPPGAVAADGSNRLTRGPEKLLGAGKSLLLVNIASAVAEKD